MGLGIEPALSVFCQDCTLTGRKYGQFMLTVIGRAGLDSLPVSNITTTCRTLSVDVPPRYFPDRSARHLHTTVLDSDRWIQERRATMANPATVIPHLLRPVFHCTHPAHVT